MKTCQAKVKVGKSFNSLCGISVGSVISIEMKKYQMKFHVNKTAITEKKVILSKIS